MAGLVGMCASSMHTKRLLNMPDLPSCGRLPAGDRDLLAFPQSLCSFSGRQHPWLEFGGGKSSNAVRKRQRTCGEGISVRKKDVPGRERSLRGATCGALREGFDLPFKAAMSCRGSIADEAGCLLPDEHMVLRQFLLAVPTISALKAALTNEYVPSGEGYRDENSRTTMAACSSSGTAVAGAGDEVNFASGPGMFQNQVHWSGVQFGLGREKGRPVVPSTSRLRWREAGGRGPHAVQATSHHHHRHGGGTHHAELPRPRHTGSDHHHHVQDDRWRLDDSDKEGGIDEEKVASAAVRTVKISSIRRDRHSDDESDMEAVGELEAEGFENGGVSHRSVGNGSANGGTLTVEEANGSSCSISGSGLLDALAAVGKEPMYQVVEVTPDGKAQEREVSRRQLLRCASLRLRDIRRIDPSLWVTNSLPALLVRDDAILLNLGSLRAVTTTDSVLIFDYNSVGGKAFLDCLLNKLEQDRLNGGGPVMPFELEVLEAALTSRLQRLEEALMKVEPRVKFLLQVLPTKLNADFLEELRISKQALVELASKAGALRQTLLELLEHNPDIRRITNMGRNGKMKQGKAGISAVDKRVAEEEEQEVEMLLEFYLQRCDFIHGQSERLLDSAKEAEDSIAVNLSSRRLEVSKLELLLQVGTFCTAIGALIAGIFGMNLRSRLEEHAMAFWIATGCIVWGGVILFAAMLFYLMRRRIL